MCLSFIPGRLYTICPRLSSQVYNINTKAADPRSETGDTNTSTRKISPLNYFVLGKNSPVYRINNHLQTYKAISTCPRIVGMDFQQNISKPKFYRTLKARSSLPRLLGDLVCTGWHLSPPDNPNGKGGQVTKQAR